MRANADRLRRRRAGAGDGETRTGRAVADADVGGRRAWNAARNGERRRPALLDEVEIDAVLDGANAADAGADDRGGARAHPLAARQARLRHRLVGGRQQILGDRIAERKDALLEVGGGVEALHLRRELDAAAIGPLELRWADARAPVPRGAPERVGANSRRRHRAHPGDDDPAR